MSVPATTSRRAVLGAGVTGGAVLLVLLVLLGLLGERIAHAAVVRTNQFTLGVASGTTVARASRGHSVHVDARGLAADRNYWYRFKVGSSVSPVVNYSWKDAD